MMIEVEGRIHLPVSTGTMCKLRPALLSCLTSRPSPGVGVLAGVACSNNSMTLQETISRSLHVPSNELSVKGDDEFPLIGTVWYAGVSYQAGTVAGFTVRTGRRSECKNARVIYPIS